MPHIFDFYEVVDVLAGSASIALGVSGSRGVVVGLAGEGEERSYAVLVGDKTYMLHGSDLTPTGHHVSREDIYRGETARAFPENYS